MNVPRALNADVIASSASVPACLRSHAASSGRPLIELAGRHLDEVAAGARSLLFAAPEGDPVWDAVVSALFAGAAPETAVFFLPYPDEDTLAAALTSPAPAVSKRIGLVLHARPYCGRLSRGGVTVGLCTSARGADGVCHVGHPCAITPNAVEPAAALASPEVFLNGCSTAYPPVAGLWFPPSALLGYHLYRHGARVVLGNLGLGPAAAWEPDYLEGLAAAGVDLVDRVRSLNRVRARLGCHPGFRLVGFGDGASAAPAEVCSAGAVARSGRSVTIEWAEPARPAWARVPREWLDAPRGVAAILGGIGRVVCVDDPIGGDYFVVASGQPAEIQLVARDDDPDATNAALADAVQGIAALLAGGEQWPLHGALAAVRSALSSMCQLDLLHRVCPPTVAELEARSRALRSICANLAETTLRALLDGLRAGTTDLGELYGLGTDSDNQPPQPCPVCGRAGWRRTRAVHGLGEARHTQFQCPLCAIVYDGPSYLDIGAFELRGEPGLEFIVPVTNRARFPVTLAWAWQAEERMASGRPAYNELGDDIALSTVEAGDCQQLRFATSASFARGIRLFTSANGRLGFVQIKDAVAAARRPS